MSLLRLVYFIVGCVCEGNALFSPVSILTTLNMLLLGTVGQTRGEILEALGWWDVRNIN